MFHMPALRKLLVLPATHDVVIDQCMYGLHDPVSHILYRKPTRIIGNVPLLPGLRVSCDGSHSHEPILGKVKHNNTWVSRSEIAGAYPLELCKQWASIVVQSLKHKTFCKQHRLAQTQFCR